MKIKLTDDLIVKINPCEGMLGCHLIECDRLQEAPCNIWDVVCNLEKKGLEGGYYPITEVKDLLIL